MGLAAAIGLRSTVARGLDAFLALGLAAVVARVAAHAEATGRRVVVVDRFAGRRIAIGDGSRSVRGNERRAGHGFVCWSGLGSLLGLLGLVEIAGQLRRGRV